MKAELKPRPHNLVPGAVVYEIWWGGQRIGEVVGADGPGVRVLSNYPMVVQADRGLPNMTTVLMARGGGL